MKILSIDAWGSEEEGYDWNAWYNVGTISKEEFEALKDYDFITWFIDNGFLLNVYNAYAMYDDDYNIVITDKKTGKPLYAIEYGADD